MTENKIAEGAYCEVIAGVHKGKSGRVKDPHLSKTGHLTLTVWMNDNNRFKTLAKNIKVISQKEY